MSVLSLFYTSQCSLTQSGELPYSRWALTTAQLAFPQSTQGLSLQAPWVGTHGLVPQPG